jgi:hypothetical protein
MRKIVYTVIGIALAAVAAAAGLLAQQLWSSDSTPAAATAALSPADRIAACLPRPATAWPATPRAVAPLTPADALQTPFGNVISPNITADRATGIGAWSADDFWHALTAASRDGRLLYPAFPYTNYTRVTRDDADALYAYLQTVPAVSQANQPHQLRFTSCNSLRRGARCTCRRYSAGQGQSVEWNRGAYLVQGLGHCSACHSARNPLGAPPAKACRAA